MRLMKLLQIMASNKLGGAENFFCRLSHTLYEQGLNQSLIMRNQSQYIKELKEDIRYFTLPFKGTLDFRSPYLLQKIIQQEKPKIVLTWLNRASGIVSKLYRHKTYSHIARLGGYYNLNYYQHCDYFIANTRGIADYLIQSGIPQYQVHYISNFVDETPGEILVRPTEKPLLLALARLHKNKALDLLIKAMTFIPYAELWIAGSGPEEATLKKLVTALGLSERIKFLGWVEHTRDLIATADLFICPSRHEPLGNVILEAWAQGKPVVSTRNQGACELITHEENGYLVETENPRSLAKGILTVLENKELTHTIAEQGQQTYQKNFSKAHITRQYLEFLHSVP